MFFNFIVPRYRKCFVAQVGLVGLGMFLIGNPIGT